jgi:2,3-diketo-5-methylthio-1-phosphopentane phosphatase
VKAILLDIEGTTTSVSFVFDVLFPYARSGMRKYLEEHAGEPDHERLIGQLHDEHDADRAARHPVPPWFDDPGRARIETVADYAAWLMDRDRKSTPLKELQGRIWKEGYRRGELRADVFDDVPVALERWTSRNLRVGIFSSGSVLAQQLLFKHTTAGDLSGFLECYFDTTSGAKTEPASYARIATAMDLSPGSMLFVSDTTRELDAARSAGYETRLSVRPGNPHVPDGHRHPIVRTLTEI